MTELELLRQHVDVLFELDADGRLMRLREPGDEPPPRVFLARGRSSHVLRFRADVAPRTVAACRDVATNLPAWTGEPSDPATLAPLRFAIERDVPAVEACHGIAWQFGERVVPPGSEVVKLIDERTAALLERHFPYTHSVRAARSPVVGAVVDGCVVAACFSARTSATAAEAGVATAEPYRGRGLAPLVVSVWRDAVERAGMRPLYSADVDNAASRAVARKLRMIAYAETLTVT